MRTLLGLGLALAAFAATPASAAEYLFTIGGNATASGTLTVGNIPGANGGSLITAITGTYDGEGIIGILPVDTLGGNDNFLFLGESPLLSFGGFAFSLPSGEKNIYASGNSYFSNAQGGITFAISAAAVPEPGTWAMMLIGFGVAGVALRRRGVERLAA